MSVNWPGLLAWSSKHHDGTKDAKDFKPLSDEDKEFLEGALAEAFKGQVDANEMMHEALQKIHSAGDDSDVVNTALEVVDKCCDYPDVPKNLARLGGVPIMLKLLEHPDVHAACRGTALFTIMLSSNSEVQKATAADHGIAKLIKFTERGDEAFFRGLSCLAALVRHEPELEKDFVKHHHGDKLLKNALGKDKSMRVRTKGASLLRHLLVEKQLWPSEMLDQFAQCVADILPMEIDHMQYGETLAALTSALYDHFKDSRSRAPRDDGLHALCEAAKQRIAALKKLDEDRSAEIDLLEDLDKQRRTSDPPKREDIKMLQG